VGIKYAAWCVLAYFLYLAVRVLAGNITVVDANIVFRILLKTPHGVTIVVSVLVNVFVVSWGLRQQSAHRGEVRYLLARIKTYESIHESLRILADKAARNTAGECNGGDPL